MQQLSGFPYADARFGKEGRPVDAADATGVLALLADTGITDLLVLAHGWNNDMDDARRLYRQMAASLAGVQDRVPGLNGRSLAVAGVLWPSKKFAESDLIPGGTAALTGAAGVGAAAVQEQIDELTGFLSGPDADEQLKRARELVGELDRSAARREFAERIRAALPPEGRSEDDASDRLFDADPGRLMERLAVPVTLVPPTAGRSRGGAAGGVGGASAAAGGAAGLGSILGGVRGAARNMLNFATYYEMKNRAGTVGGNGVAALLERVHQHRPDVAIHLAGHSFGGRLVTAAAAARQPVPFASLTLMQAAFSHYGFARDWKDGKDGAFRGVLTGRRVTGPILITHTGNDRAVGIAYALASRVAGQVAAQVGDRDDMYGGIGRNGALRTPEARDARLLDVGGGYELEPGRVHNLLSDPFVRSHSDVTGRQVAYAILSAVAAS